MKYILTTISLLIFLISASHAVIIKDIKINNNKRITEETIVTYGNIELNKEYPKIFSHTEPHTVVQYANALQLDEIVNWWEKISHPAFRTKQYFRILDQPSYYDIRNLNQKIKDKIQDRYRNIKKLKHVVNYLKTNNSLHDSEMGYNIFSESCLINKVNPLSSHVHKEMEDAIQ